MKIEDIIIDNYHFKLRVIFSSPKEFKDHLKETYDYKLTGLKRCDGMVIHFKRMKKDASLIMWLDDSKGPVSHHVIAHECNHATFYVFKEIGEQKITPNSEAYTRTLDYLVKRVISYEEDNFPIGNIGGLLCMLNVINTKGDPKQMDKSMELIKESCGLPIKKRNKKLRKLWDIFSEIMKNNKIES